MANLRAEQKTSVLFTLWLEDIDSAYDALDSDIVQQIQRMRQLGVSDKEIFDTLLASLNDGADMFQTFKGAIGRANDTLVNTTSQVESNESIKHMAEMWTWELDPLAKEHCDDCKRNSLAGAQTYDYWENVGLPGFGTTQCKKYCKCTLLPVK